MLESFRLYHRPLAAGESLPPGTPLVVLKNAEAFFKQGLMQKEGLLFGLLVENGDFLCRAPLGGEACAALHRCTMPQLADWGYDFFVPTGDFFAADKAAVLQRAHHPAAPQNAEYVSPIGDDFVYECLTGKSMLTYISEHPRVGKLASVSFSVRELLSRSEYIRKRLEAQQQSDKAAKVQGIMDALQEIADLNELNLYNRAVCVGDGLVANFSAVVSETDGQDTCELCLKPLQNFARDGELSSVKYASRAWFGDLSKRLCARNMALRILAERPKFSLRRYNSEHFSYFCTEGKLKSPQKRALFLKPTKMLLPSLSWLNPIRKVRKIYKTIVCIFILRDLVCALREK